jgi:hypothetical protein
MWASPTAPGLAMTSATYGLREFGETRAKGAATIEKNRKRPKVATFRQKTETFMTGPAKPLIQWRERRDRTRDLRRDRPAFPQQKQ